MPLGPIVINANVIIWLTTTRLCNTVPKKFLDNFLDRLSFPFVAFKEQLQPPSPYLLYPLLPFLLGYRQKTYLHAQWRKQCSVRFPHHASHSNPCCHLFLWHHQELAISSRFFVCSWLPDNTLWCMDTCKNLEETASWWCQRKIWQCGIEWAAAGWRNVTEYLQLQKLGRDIPLMMRCGAWWGTLRPPGKCDLIFQLAVGTLIGSVPEAMISTV